MTVQKRALAIGIGMARTRKRPSEPIGHKKSARHPLGRIFRPKKMVIVFVCVNPRILGSEKPVHISLMVYGTQQYPGIGGEIPQRIVKIHPHPFYTLKFFKFFNHIVGKFT